VDTYNPDLLSRSGLNTLMFEDPYAKLDYLAGLVQSTERVVYVDLDTTMTAYISAGFIRPNRIAVFLPSKGRFMASFKDAISAVQNSSLVVFDSVNSFYSVYYDYSVSAGRQSIGDLNRLLSVCLMLLLRQAISCNVPMLVTSMLRYRKDGGWKQSPASRRLLQQKSATRMKVKRSDDAVILEIVQHPEIKPGTVLSYSPTLSGLQSGIQAR
jgi:hypothetical protein